MKVNEIVNEAPYKLGRRIFDKLASKVPIIKDAAQARRLMGLEANEVKRRWKQWVATLDREDRENITIDDIQNFFDFVGYSNSAEHVLGRLAREIPKEQPKAEPEDFTLDDDMVTEDAVGRHVTQNIDKVIMKVLAVASQLNPALFTTQAVQNARGDDRTTKSADEPVRQRTDTRPRLSLDREESGELVDVMRKLEKNEPLSARDQRFLKQIEKAAGRE